MKPTAAMASKRRRTAKRCEATAFYDGYTLGELLRKLQAAGRKDLWGTPEGEAKPEAAT